MSAEIKVIISGGGTGGHIFPAIAIADAVRKQQPKADILFVGAMGRMEMERVPKAGYPIEGLWISGFQRSLSLRNLLFPVKLVHSLLSARRILRRFQPDVVVGVGGYASGPLLEMATRMGIPTLIQEQNSYAGVTNRLLAKKVSKVCVAYSGMEKYFPADKIVHTGNPVRNTLFDTNITKEEAAAFFGMDSNRPIVLVFGGSLGAKALNEAMANAGQTLRSHSEIQVIWQCGAAAKSVYAPHPVANMANVRLYDFLERMDMAYAAADVVVARAGALTISELSLAGKAAILVPSPFVAEDHQTKNAQALVEAHAALMVPNASVQQKLWPEIIQLLADVQVRDVLERRIRSLGKPQAAEHIATELLKLTKKYTTQNDSHA